MWQTMRKNLKRCNKKPWKRTRMDKMKAKKFNECYPKLHVEKKPTPFSMLLGWLLLKIYYRRVEILDREIKTLTCRRFHIDNCYNKKITQKKLVGVFRILQYTHIASNYQPWLKHSTYIQAYVSNKLK